MRNGVIVRFDPVTLAPAQVNDLLPDAAKIPGAEQIPDQVQAALNSERPLRVATPLLFPVANELAVLIPGAGYYRLDAMTLKTKTIVGPRNLPLPHPGGPRTAGGGTPLCRQCRHTGGAEYRRRQPARQSEPAETNDGKPVSVRFFSTE